MSPALHERLGIEATVGLLELFDTARQEWTADMTTTISDRFERRIMEEIGALRAENREFAANLRADMRELGVSLRAEIREMGATVRAEMKEDRFELLKWCFVFWVGQFFAVAGVVVIITRSLQP
jgi:hypothetical protein